MVRIIAKGDFAAQVAELSEAADVYDETGRLMGRYEPFPSKNRSKEGYYIPDFDEEELDRIEQEPGGSTLTEIWERLKRQ
jgi:hypothetical protein